MTRIMALAYVGTLAALSSALAVEPCAEMVRITRAHAAHALLPDSDPGTLNPLLNQASAAVDECYKKYTAVPIG